MAKARAHLYVEQTLTHRAGRGLYIEQTLLSAPGSMDCALTTIQLPRTCSAARRFTAALGANGGGGNSWIRGGKRQGPRSNGPKRLRGDWNPMEGGAPPDAKGGATTDQERGLPILAPHGKYNIL